MGEIWQVIGKNAKIKKFAAFLISAFLAFVRPNPLIENLAVYATIFTLIGAVCFFVGAYLMWPEMSAEAIDES